MKYEVEADSSKEQQGRERKPTVVYLSSLQLFLEISAEWLDADHAKYLLWWRKLKPHLPSSSGN